MHRTTPLLYMKFKLSPAELFFGCRLASNLPVIYSSNPELVAERQPSDNSSRTRNVNFEPSDNVWVHLSPTENSWKQGTIIHSVVGVPDSFIVEINNGQQYRQNKCDITFSPPKCNDSAVGGATGNQCAKEKEENRTYSTDFEM